MFLRETTNSNSRFWAVLLFLGVFFFGYTTASAATLRITSGSATLSPGSIATLVVSLDSEGVAINNAEAKIVFPTDLLEVVSISKGNSIFSLWVEEPAFSNTAGTISFNGGVPTPGFNGAKGTTISIVVKAKKAGQAEVSFSEAAVRANDGYGTDVLKAKTGKTLSVAPKEEPVVTETPELQPVSEIAALPVTSPTHPLQESWYKDSSPTFSWKLSAGVDAIQTGIDNNPSSLPVKTFSPAVNERTVEDLEDGVWYFKVRARETGKWGPVSTYVTRIDSKAPQMSDVVYSYDDDTNLLSIAASIVDEASGLDHYEVFINDVLAKNIPSEEFINGVYTIAVDSPGNNTVKLVAVDRAGNSVESVGSFKATTAPELPTQSVPMAHEPLLISVGSFTMPLVSFIVLVLLVALIVTLVAFALGHYYGTRSTKRILSTAGSNGDATKKGLLTLKKRLEKHLELLQRTRHKRILSKEEKEIKDAVEEDLDEVDRAIEKLKEHASQ